jgi:hypothetical protein
MNTRNLPIGVQDFAKIRLGGNVYVDKIEYLWNIVQMDSPYFLARPRRFGKSLFASTLNQLNDMSLDDNYSGICGISKTELIANFDLELRMLVCVFL